MSKKTIGGNKKIISLLYRTFFHISSRRRMHFLLLLLLTIFTSCLEIISLGSVVPFISVLTQPQELYNSENFRWVIEKFNFTDPNQLLAPLTLLFGFAAILAGIFRIFLLKVGIVISNATGADLSVDVYRKTLYQPYEVHISRSSSEIISVLTEKVRVITSIIASIINIITSLFLLVAIIGTLIFIDPYVALISLFSFGFCYFLIALLTKTRLKINSIKVADVQTLVIKALQEGLGSIREVLLSSSQSIYTSSYKRIMERLLFAIGENQFITLFPRFAMETVGMVLIASLAYLVTYESENIMSTLPVLAAMAVAAQRLLPLLQLFYANWTNVVGNQAAMRDVLDLLDQSINQEDISPDQNKISFIKDITLKNISFKYSGENKWILRDANLRIKKGSKVGFIGETGSGKSTTLDLIMSLLYLSGGEILIDGVRLSKTNRKQWKSLISHVPQSIFLIDSSISENIAFGEGSDLINIDRVQEVSEKAHISDFIESLEYKYQTIVGEGGARLSGGQRQRIGIARALYKKSQILIFDEATSALDSKTEKEVMKSLDNIDENLTILIIAHRITTLASCDSIILVEDNNLINMGSYSEFIKSNKFLSLQSAEKK